MNVALPPALAQFVKAQLASGRYQDASDVVRAALQRAEAQAAAATYHNLGTLDGQDIEALAFIVMMEAAKSAQEDLKAIMAQVKAINNAKQRHRQLLQQVQRDAAANKPCPPEPKRLDFTRGLGTERAYHRAQLPLLDPDAPGGVRLAAADLWPRRIESAADLDAIVDRLKGDLDSLSELGELESLRLQMAMDRLSKLMSTLSNLLKKVSDTAQAITQNLK